MPKRKFTNEQEKELARRYLSGESARAIGHSLGTDKTVVIAALKRTGTPQRTPSERNRLYKLDGNIFDKIDMPEKSYWWGFLYADASIHKRSLNLKLQRRDESHIFKFKEFLKSKHPVHQAITTIDNTEYLFSGLYVTDGHMIDRLKELGVISHRPYFRTVVSNLPSRFIPHWIRGYFDGDGYIAPLKNKKGKKQGSIKLLGQIELLEWIRNIFHIYCGTSVEQKIRKAGHSQKIWTLDYSGRKQCERIGDFLYKDANIFLERKHIRFLEYKIPPKEDWWKRPMKNGRFIKKGEV